MGSSTSTTRAKLTAAAGCTRDRHPKCHSPHAARAWCPEFIVRSQPQALDAPSHYSAKNCIPVLPCRQVAPTIHVLLVPSREWASSSRLSEDPSQQVTARGDATYCVVLPWADQSLIRMYQIRRAGVIVEHRQGHHRCNGSCDVDYRAPRAGPVTGTVK